MKRPPKKGSAESRAANMTSNLTSGSERDESPAPRRPSLKKTNSYGSASDDADASPPRARGKPAVRPDARTPPPREGNQFKEMQLALEAAPLGLKMLGMASEAGPAWSTLEPAAAIQISDALARQASASPSPSASASASASASPSP